MTNQQLSQDINPKKVVFIGAGPGDPGLLTLKAHAHIQKADLILYAGSLVNPDILEYAKPGCECRNTADMKLEEQVDLMAAGFHEGKLVLRLHTGDPAIYSAIHEQTAALDKLNVPYEVIPGVSAAFAAAAALAAELTVPELTQTIIFTRLSGRTKVPESETLRKLAAHRASLVIFLSVGMISSVVDECLAAGLRRDMPVAVVYRASWPQERIIRATLADIADQVQQAEIDHQALIIISPALKTAPDQAEALSHLYGSALDAAQRQDNPAIITLTRSATQTGLRLLGDLPQATLYSPARFLEAGVEQADNVSAYTVSVRQVLQSAFQTHSTLVCIMAAGIVMRDLAPLLVSKHTDPGVVVMDEKGKYAVSLLGGHKGGANRMARRLSDLLGGQAVLTTASDGQDLPALDLLGAEYNWVLCNAQHLTAVIAALVNGDPVGVVQEAGSKDWLPDPLPHNLRCFSSFQALWVADPAASIFITYRDLSKIEEQQAQPLIVYHPACLSVGVGCNRNTAAEDILAAVEDTLYKHGLSLCSVKQVATIEDKANEPGLLEVCRIKGWHLKVFSRQEINEINPPNPSAWAQKALGVAGVCEPAALLAAGVQELLVEKQKYADVTVAVALQREEA